MSNNIASVYVEHYTFYNSTANKSKDSVTLPGTKKYTKQLPSIGEKSKQLITNPLERTFPKRHVFNLLKYSAGMLDTTSLAKLYYEHIESKIHSFLWKKCFKGKQIKYRTGSFVNFCLNLAEKRNPYVAILMPLKGEKLSQ